MHSGQVQKTPQNTSILYFFSLEVSETGGDSVWPRASISLKLQTHLGNDNITEFDCTQIQSFLQIHTLDSKKPGLIQLFWAACPAQLRFLTAQFSFQSICILWQDSDLFLKPEANEVTPHKTLTSPT